MNIHRLKDILITNSKFCDNSWLLILVFKKSFCYKRVSVCSSAYTVMVGKE